MMRVLRCIYDGGGWKAQVVVDRGVIRRRKGKKEVDARGLTSGMDRQGLGCRRAR